MLVSDVMSKNLKSIAPDATISTASAKMKEYSIRHLVVLEEKTRKLLGIISDRDIKKIVSPFAGSEHATERDNATLQVAVHVVMRKKPMTIGPDDKLKNAAELMLQKKVSSIIVINEQEVAVGIVTTDDMIRTLVKVL
jgi:acetoin utilization protein AcuB